MRLHEAAQLITHHLRRGPGRIQTIAARLQDAGLLSKTEGSRRYPDDISHDEIVILFVAAITETSLGAAATTTSTFAALADGEGTRFDQAVADLLFREDVPPSDIAVHIDPPAATIAIAGQVVVFGADEPASGAISARFVDAHTIAALRADLRKEP
ncbi:hypothetical protein [Shinella granuli]|uniref:Uncharacterized protein n=1 Tax=Shinella granuli TaxID=323621 RepID=A0A4R2CSV9_SHIGR|nr:hypothetical protein [Shinella granuli]TCN42419.1 hypothetical protein EV665_112154 [Shinella granuli]